MTVIESRDGEGRLHAENQPAYVSPVTKRWYENGELRRIEDIYGTVSYFYKGMMVPPQFIIDIYQVPLEEILKHPNVEIRRAGLELWGMERIEQHKACKVIHQNRETGAKLLRVGDFQYVRVIDGTPRPDGTRKIYYLCVPPTMKDVDEAIAWTFEQPKNGYHPQVET